MRRRNQNKGFSLFIILVLIVATVVPQWVCDVAELQVVHADPQTHHTAHPLIWDEDSKSVVTDNSRTVSFNIPITSSSAFPNNSGSYYLVEDVTFTEPVPSSTFRSFTISGENNEVNIDLNGKDIEFEDGDGSAIVIDGATLNIYDSSADQMGYILGRENTISEDYDESYGGCISIVNGGKLNIYGGNITGATRQSGGAVHINNGEVNLFDGRLYGMAGHAGAISVGREGNTSATLKMYGGEIAGLSGSWGGAMQVFGTAEIFDGIIGDPSGVLVFSEDEEDPLSFDTGATGGGIWVNRPGTLKMHGGSIEYCIANKRGGGVGVDAGATFEMDGGIIHNNYVIDDVNGKGGGVYVYRKKVFPGSQSPLSPTIKISGTAEITDNYIGNPESTTTQNNIYIDHNNSYDEVRLNIPATFTGQAGITVANLSLGRVLTSGFGMHNTDTASSHFTYDDGTYQINKNANGEAILSDTPDVPTSSSTSSSSSGGSSSSSGSSGPSATNARKGADGRIRVTDASGKPITSSLVTVMNTDATGMTASKHVLTDESGYIANRQIITVKRQVSASGKSSELSKTYLACSDGTIYNRPGFAEVESTIGLSISDISISGTVVFVNKDGSIKKSEKFTVTTKSGKKIYYAADDNGKIIRNGFFNAKKTGVTEKSIKAGATYFAGANGQIITKALFTVKTTKSGKMKIKINKKGSLFSQTVLIDDMEVFMDLKGAGLKNKKGEQYYATASGKVAKDKWVNVGLKQYYCGSNGKITKSK